MAKRVEPKVFLIGYTTADLPNIGQYLRYTNQTEFMDEWNAAMRQGVSEGEALCSLYAKLCYKSLTVGKNLNVKTVRDIPGNLRGAFDSGHGSVFEHCSINFVVTDCSRVYTHEQCRHRVGWAYSQTSGRYCRGDSLDLILDPITEPVNDEILLAMGDLERTYQRWCSRMGLNGLKGLWETMRDKLVNGGSRVIRVVEMSEVLAEAKRLGMRECKPNSETGEFPMFQGHHEQEHDFEIKKKITSALRRPLPNGQANEMGMTVNLRSLRHVVQLRTARSAEWEIRSIFNQVYDLVNIKFPLAFYGATVSIYDGLREISGMKQQPYAGVPAEAK